MYLIAFCSITGTFFVLKLRMNFLLSEAERNVNVSEVSDKKTRPGRQTRGQLMWDPNKKLRCYFRHDGKKPLKGFYFFT